MPQTMSDMSEFHPVLAAFGAHRGRTSFSGHDPGGLATAFQSIFFRSAGLNAGKSFDLNGRILKQRMEKISSITNTRSTDGNKFRQFPLIEKKTLVRGPRGHLTSALANTTICRIS